MMCCADILSFYWLSKGVWTRGGPYSKVELATGIYWVSLNRHANQPFCSSPGGERKNEQNNRRVLESVLVAFWSVMLLIRNGIFFFFCFLLSLCFHCVLCFLPLPPSLKMKICVRYWFWALVAQSESIAQKLEPVLYFGSKLQRKRSHAHIFRVLQQ